MESSRMELATKFFELRERKDKVAAELKDINGELDEVEKALVLSLESENLQNFKDARYGTIYLREAVYARVEDEEKFFPWLEETGQADVIKKVVHAKTLSSMVKNMTLDGKELPPGVTAQFMTEIGLRREKGG